MSWDVGNASKRTIAEFRDAVFDEMFAAENVKLRAKYPRTEMFVRQTRPRLAAGDERLAYVLTDFGKGYFGNWSMKFGWAVNAEREKRQT